MLHYLNGTPVDENHPSPDVLHVHQQCIEWYALIIILLIKLSKFASWNFQLFIFVSCFTTKTSCPFLIFASIRAPQIYFAGDIAMNVEAELSRAAKIKCSSCGMKGAALGCYVRSCRKSFHVPCAFGISGCRRDYVSI